MENPDFRKEVDQLILRCIAKYGYDGVPYDYYFLSRYKLFTSFFLNTELNKESASAGPADTKETFQSLVSPHISECSFTTLKLYYQVHGEEATRILLYRKSLYFDLLKKYLSKK